MKKIIVTLFIFLLLTGCQKDTKGDNINININEMNNYINDDNSSSETNNTSNTNDNNDTNNKVEDSSINSSSNNNQNNNITQNKDDNTLLESEENINSEEDVINYFSKIKDKIVDKLNSDTFENAKESIMEALDKLYGFCFKGEKIGNYTLKDLSSTAKEKIFNIVFDIDSFVESKIPGYKDLFKDGYDNMITSAKKALGIVKDKITDFFN